MKWVIVDCFWDYLYYVLYFMVYSDNNFLCYVFIMFRLDVIWFWWISELVDFNFFVKYKLGFKNRDVDGLSCMLLDFVIF